MSSNDVIVRDKIILGVDLDEVVFQYVPGLRKFMKENGHTPPEQSPEFYSLVDSGWFDSNEDYYKIHREAVEQGVYSKLEQVPGASEALWELNDLDYEINIITARFVNPGQHEKVAKQTAAALEEHNIPYSSLTFLSDKKRFLADTYIDDSPNNIIGLRSIGRHVITFDQSYNRGVIGARASSWDGVKRLLHARYGR